MIKNYTQQDIKLAHQIVQEDLLNSLSNLQDGQSLRLGSLGKFTKKEHQMRSALFKKKLGLIFRSKGNFLTRTKK